MEIKKHLSQKSYLREHDFPGLYLIPSQAIDLGQLANRLHTTAGSWMEFFSYSTKHGKSYIKLNRQYVKYIGNCFPVSNTDVIFWQMRKKICEHDGKVSVSRSV